MLCYEPITINHKQADVTIRDAIEVCHFMNKVFFLNQWIQFQKKYHPYLSHGRVVGVDNTPPPPPLPPPTQHPIVPKPTPLKTPI